MRNRGIAQKPSDAGERLEMIGAGTFGGKQQEHQIDWLIIERLEIDRPFKAREQSKKP